MTAPHDASAPFRLSLGQEALWFLHLGAPDSSAYHCLGCARIRSAIDERALERTVRALADRHPMLRARFSSKDGVPWQRIEADAPASFRVVDASGWDEARVEALQHEALHQPFDLANGAPYRFVLIRLGPGEHRLAFAIHHLVYDGMSSATIFADLRRLYAAERAGIRPEPPAALTDYRDFVEWQRELVTLEAGERQLEFWRRKLAGAPAALTLPTDRPRTTPGMVGGAVPLNFSAEKSAALHALAQGEGVTLYMLLLAAYQLLLARYSGQEEVLVGAPAFGRTQPRFQHTVGYFVNPIVFRSRVMRNQPFREFLREVRDTVLESLANQDYPFPRLVEKLAPPRDPTRNPIFQVFLDWQKREWIGDHVRAGGEGAVVRYELGELSLEDLDVPQQEGIFELTLDVKEVGRQLYGEWKYDAALFDRTTAERMEANFQTLLDGILADPRRRIGQLPLVSAAERTLLVEDWNRTERAYDRDRCVHELFEDRVDAAPHALAVRSHDGTLTYAELDRRANQLARRLIREGVTADQPVGICHTRGCAMMVGLLGIWKAGGGYVPLDPDYPQERLDTMVADSGLRIVVSESALADRVSAPGVRTVLLDGDADSLGAEDATRPAGLGRRPEDLAYLIYTSGSTGRPKGVEVLHRGVVNCLQATARLLDFHAGDALLAVTTISFDIHAKQLFLPLCFGGVVDVAEQECARDGKRLLERMRSSGARFLQATPTHWGMVLGAGWDERLPLHAISIGEPLRKEMVAQLAARTAGVWNTYGPTEATIQSTVHPVRETDPFVSLGRPFDNTTFYVLDPSQQLVPIGVLGELYIGGDGLARGYHDLPEKTAERFVRSPFRRGERLYRTGDLVRHHPSGQLEMEGRIDHQVKVRGVRIELEEIEAVLVQHEGVASAVVKVFGQSDVDKRLVAFAVPTSRPEPSRAAIRRHLRTKLPESMVPSSIVWLDSFPQTPSGKVDRNALVEDSRETVAREETMVPAEGPVETLLAAIWAEVLEVRKVGAFDNFFDLGGNSLKSLQVVDRFEKATGRRLNPAELVNQTVRQIAARGTPPPPKESAAPPKEDRGFLARLRRVLPGRDPD